MRLKLAIGVGFILSGLVHAEDRVVLERIDIGVTQDLLDVSVVETALTIAGQKGTLLQSQDGGEHWKLLKSGTDATLRRVRFLNKNIGFAIGDGGSYPSEPLTEHHLVAHPDRISQEPKDSKAKPKFGEADVGIPSTVLKTQDSGATWQRIPVMTNFPLTDLHIIDEKRALLCTGDIAEGMLQHDGDIMASNDGGETWHGYMIALGAPCHKIALDESGNGAVVRHAIEHKHDKLTEDDVMSLPASLRVSERIEGDPNILWMSAFGGGEWKDGRKPRVDVNKVSAIKVATCSDLYGACMRSGKIWVCGKAGALASTTIVDGKPGEWNISKSGTGSDLVAVAFVDDVSGFAVGKGGACVQTADGGATWTAIDLGTHADLNAIAFTRTHAVIVGAKGLILRMKVKGAKEN